MEARNGDSPFKVEVEIGAYPPLRGCHPYLPYLNLHEYLKCVVHLFLLYIIYHDSVSISCTYCLNYTIKTSIMVFVLGLQELALKKKNS